MPLPAIFVAIGEGVVLLGPRLAPMALALRTLFQTEGKLVNNQLNPVGLAVAAGAGYAVNEMNQGRADARLAQELAQKERMHREMLAAMAQQGARVDGRFSELDTRMIVLDNKMRDHGHDLSLARVAIDGVRRGVDGVSGKIDKLTRQFEVGGCPAPALASFATPAGALPPGLAASSTRRAFAPLPVAFVPGLEPAF